jgi:hypothetical protein
MTGNLDSKILYVNYLKSLLPFFNVNDVSLFGITQEPDIRVNPLIFFQPTVFFMQLALIEIGLFFLVRRIVQVIRKNRDFNVFAILAVNVFLTLIGLLYFSLSLGELEAPSVFAPISFFWLMSFGAIFNSTASDAPSGTMVQIDCPSFTVSFNPMILVLDT